MSAQDNVFRGDQHSALVDDVTNWLVERSLDETPLEKIVEGCCLRLHGAGIPLSRVSLAFRTLHPLFRSVSIIWTHDEELQVTGHQHQTVTNEAWLNSPLFYMLKTEVPRLRRHITGDEALLDFPILEELRDNGMTDYMSYMIPYGDRTLSDDIEDGINIADGILGSWATDRESGFTDGHIRALQRVEQRLAVLCKIKTRDQIVRNLLQAYLGKDAGEQVLKGQIQRGDVKSIYSVVWYSDLRSSTNMADAMEPVKFLEILNKYFECSAGAVLDHGGEVLRFVGDAVLAIFPIRDEKKAQNACRDAMCAAKDAQSRLKKMNDQRAQDEPEIAFGLGLHVGEVLFGNIGVPERLEFSVIGPAANEVARLEDLTKQMGRSIVVSGEFAENVDIPWEHMGDHTLRGVDATRPIYAIPAKFKAIEERVA